MNTVDKLKDECFRIQKTSYERGPSWKINRPKCFVAQKLCPSFHHFMKKINYALVHFHLLHESFKTTSVL